MIIPGEKQGHSWLEDHLYFSNHEIKEIRMKHRILVGVVFNLVITNSFAVNIEDIDGALKTKISSHCELELENARYASDLLSSPTLFSNISISPEQSPKSGQRESLLLTNKVGLKYRISDYREAQLLRQFAESECQYFKYNMLRESYLNAFYPINEVNALNAKRNVIQLKLEELKTTVKGIEEKFKVQNATLQQLFGWQHIVFKLQQKIIEIDEKLEKLTQVLSNGSLYGNFSLVRNAGIQNIIKESELWQMKRTSVRRELSRPNRWDVGLSGGYQYRDVEMPVRVPAFLEVNLEYKLGYVVNREYRFNKVSSNYVSAHTNEITQKIQNKQLNESLDLSSYSRQYKLLKLRREKIENQSDLISTETNIKYDELEQKLLLEKITLDADFAYFKSKLNGSILLSDNNENNILAGLSEELSNSSNSSITPNNSRDLEGLYTGTPIELRTSNGIQTLYITNGSITPNEIIEKWTINSNTLRAHSTKVGSQFVKLEFSANSLNKEVVPLDSGEERRQIGIFMRAKNQCNLLYVMLRFEGEKINTVVQKKTNENQSTHSECGSNGYETLKPKHQELTNAITYGKPYILNAVIEKSQLSVYLDKTLVWFGGVDLSDLPLIGYAGIRADNIEMDFNFIER